MWLSVHCYELYVSLISQWLLVLGGGRIGLAQRACGARYTPVVGKDWVRCIGPRFVVCSELPVSVVAGVRRDRSLRCASYRLYHIAAGTSCDKLVTTRCGC